MSEQPLRILMLERFKDEFPRDLLPPHEFRTFSNESDEEMAQIIAETDVLISGAYKAEWRDPSGQNPKLIHSVGAGLDAIDLEAVPPGCPVCNVYGHDKGVAEHAFLLSWPCSKTSRSSINRCAKETGRWSNPTCRKCGTGIY